MCEEMTYFIGVKSELQILFVGEDENRDFLEGFLLEQLKKLLDTLSKTHIVGGVDDEDETVSIIVVVFPVWSDFSLATNVPHVQLESVLLLNTSTNKGVKIKSCLHHPSLGRSRATSLKGWVS